MSVKCNRRWERNRFCVHRGQIGWAFSAICLLAIGCFGERSSTTISAPKPTPAQTVLEPYQGILVRSQIVNETSLRDWQKRRLTVVLALLDEDTGDSATIRAAAEKIKLSGQEPEYWIEIARCEKLATEHPEWMCSLQGHDEWRRLSPDSPAPEKDSIVKTYPWVPILYKEAFVAHRDRVAELLRDLPAAKRIWLNDLQSGPSACGCGHPLCRWAADYGPLKTATESGDDAAARFVGSIRELAPQAEVIPIWTTECEEADKHGACGGVGCFDGICWRAYAKQLRNVDQVAPRIGVQCYYKAFDRDLARYGEPAGWIKFALQTFQDMPPKRDGVAIPANRLVAVLQGWDVTAADEKSQIAQAQQAGANGYLVATFPIEQSWKPQTWKLSELKR